MAVILCWYRSGDWRCHGQTQMGSSKMLPVQELPGLEEFHGVSSPGMALFRDIPCLLGGLAGSCLAACEFGGARRAPHVTALWGAAKKPAC